MKFFLFQSYSAAFCSVLWIKNNLFWIRRWLFGVLDPDFTHMLFTVSLFRNYWKKLAFIINQNEEFTNHRYLPFSISNYSPTVQQSRIRRPEIINNYNILIYLLFHSCPIRSGTSNSRSGTLVSLYARFFCFLFLELKILICTGGGAVDPRGAGQHGPAECEPSDSPTPGRGEAAHQHCQAGGT